MLKFMLLLSFFFVVFLLVLAITVACSQATVESIAVAGQKKPIPVGSAEGSCGEGVIEGRDFLVWLVEPRGGGEVRIEREEPKMARGFTCLAAVPGTAPLVDAVYRRLVRLD